MHTLPAPQLTPFVMHPGRQSSAHALFVQLPDGHIWPHPPQFFASVVKSILPQVAPQHVPVDPSDILHALP